MGIKGITIRELPPPLRRLALHRTHPERRSYNIEVREAFLWSQTIEGDRFWRDVSLGKFPELTEEDVDLMIVKDRLNEV